MIWPLNYITDYIPNPFAAPPKKPRIITSKLLHITLSFEPTRDTVQDFESDWKIYGPSDLKLALFEQQARSVEWVVEGLDEERFDELAEVVDRWVHDGRCVKAWMEERGGLAASRRWDLKA